MNWPLLFFLLRWNPNNPEQPVIFNTTTNATTPQTTTPVPALLKAKALSVSSEQQRRIRCFAYVKCGRCFYNKRLYKKLIVDEKNRSTMCVNIVRYEPKTLPMNSTTFLSYGLQMSEEFEEQHFTNMEDLLGYRVYSFDIGEDGKPARIIFAYRYRSGAIFFHRYCFDSDFCNRDFRLKSERDRTLGEAIQLYGKSASEKAAALQHKSKSVKT